MAVSTYDPEAILYGDRVHAGPVDAPGTTASDTSPDSKAAQDHAQTDQIICEHHQMVEALKRASARLDNIDNSRKLHQRRCENLQKQQVPAKSESLNNSLSYKRLTNVIIRQKHAQRELMMQKMKLQELEDELRNYKLDKN